MKTLSVIKKDIEFNKGLASLIEVLKNLAVSQYRALESRIRAFEKLTFGIEGFFELIDTSIVRHPFVNSGGNPLAVIAVTSDSGLLGGLNMQIVSHAIFELEKTPGSLIIIGERGKAYVRDSRIPFVGFPGISDEDRYAQALQLRDYVVAKALKGQIGPLKVVYARPISFTVQHVEVVSFLPFKPSAENIPGAGSLQDVILESNLSDVVEYLVSMWMGQRFYEIFGLSRLAEFSARYVHLEESLQKIKEMDSKMRLQYFRVRHELIDRNMRELFSARLLYANQ